MRTSTPHARFVLRLPTDDEAELVDVGRVDPHAWLAQLAGSERVTCCTLQGGFAIDVDGTPWNDEAIDEIRMSATWLGAIARLQQGSLVEHVWAWEESQMTLVREGSVVELSDVHHSGHVVCPRVVLPLDALASALVEAARPWLVFRAAVLSSLDGHAHADVIRENLGDDWAASVDAVHAAIGRPIPEPPEGAARPEPALHRAVKLDDRARVEAILAADPSAIAGRDREGDTALHVAIAHDRVALIEALLARGADPNASAARGCTPLHELTQRSTRAALVDVLIDAGARPDARDACAWTPLHHAARSAIHGVRSYGVDPAAVADRLLARGAHLDACAAVALGRFSELPRLAGAPILGDTIPLLVARARAQLFLVEGDANAREAILGAHLEALDRLLASGASIDDTGALFAQSGLHGAVIGRSVPLVTALLARGADPDRKCRDMSPREAAQHHGLDEMAALLARA
jgi:hypothetical protein